MKAKLLTLLVIFLVCGMALSYDSWLGKQKDSLPAEKQDTHFETVPDVAFSTLGNKAYTLHALPEKIILLHFWASWCAPCKVEFPALLKRIAHANGNIALLAVSIDDDRQAMERFVAQQDLKDQLHLYWVWDKDKNISLRQFNTSSVPETILINSRHQMTDKIVGDPNWAGQDMGQRLKALTTSPP